jgi:DNA-binding transcriptional ArsR family regulator
MRAHNNVATASDSREPNDGSGGDAAGMAVEAGDQAVFQVAAEVLGHLADPTRLRLVLLLAGGERDVGSLAGQVPASRSSVSQHLGRLRLAGLVAAHRDGRRMLYSVSSPHLVGLARQAFGFAEHRVLPIPTHHRPSIG